MHHFGRSSLAVLASAVLALLACVRPALAAWPNQSAVNLPVCRAAGDQRVPAIVPDGSGGAILTWQDARSGTYDIYAQHVLASGAVDPAWPVDGRALCTSINAQLSPAIVPDGAGGAIVAWYDFRSGSTYDIYAQHVLASGAVDPAWPANGRALCTATNQQELPNIASDGAGGAIVTWEDQRSGAFDIYAQHVLASGAVDALWPVDGRALCIATSDQVNPVIVSDGAGGAEVAWADLRAGNYDIYAQHVLASGAVDSAWPADGRAVCTAANTQSVPGIVADGSGGVLICWNDLRGGATYDIYAEHVLASGGIDGGWPANGRVVCSAASDQILPAIASDGAAGAIITWYDFRSSATYDIYAQHMLAAGAADPAWPVDGRALCLAAGDQTNPAIVSDGAGGAFVAWQDLRLVAYDIYATHVLASGALEPGWPTDGRAVSTASNGQTGPEMVSDGSGGAIITWTDIRNSNYDMFAQRVARFGYIGTPEAEVTEVKDVPNDNGGKIKLAWNASYLDVASDPNLSAYDVLRSVPPNLAAERLAHGARIASLGDDALRRPDRLAVTKTSAQTFYWEYQASVSALHYVSGYSYVASTAEDSTGYGNPKTDFMVVAHNSLGSMFWPSRADSGYSVDNLPPLPPAPFAGNYGGGVAVLHWHPNAEFDLANYRLYRGSSSGFVPSPVNRVAAPSDTEYTDPAGAPYWYKLSAVDAHGNESGFTTLLPSGTTAVPPGGELTVVALERPAPNPASGPVTLRYALPRDVPVTLAIYDAGGRLVRTLESGVVPAGVHALIWDLRDETGRSAQAGLYFVRLDAGDQHFTRRFATLK